MTHNYIRTALLGGGYRVVAPLLLSILYLLPLHATWCENTGTSYWQDNSRGDGLVVMEAERPSWRQASRRAGHGPKVDWTERTRSGANQGGYVIVGTQEQNALDLPADGARLDYNINFTTTGVHYIYFRHAAPGHRDNSIHILLDGEVVQQSQQFGYGQPAWDWRWERADNGFAIDTVGEHTISIVHREDGLPIDRIAISTNPSRHFDRRGPQTTEWSWNTGAADLTTLTTYEQDLEQAGQPVVLEAERPTRSIRGQFPFTCREWVATSRTDDASGNSYVYVVDENVRSDSFNYHLAPRLDYEVKFKRSGRHYVHLRHRGTEPGNNSVWTDFDYTDEDRFKMEKGSGVWEWETIGREASFVVPAPGTYIFSIYMREDATPVDKIILTPDPTYRATVFGPDATECASTLVYYQDRSAQHIVEMPAEAPSVNVAGKNTYSGRQWTYLTDDAAHDGQYANVTEQGSQPATGTDVPTLHYQIDFNHTGTHYLYVRYRGTTLANSVAVDLDSTQVTDHFNMPFTDDGKWTYARLPEALEIKSLGRHTLSLRMREDGTSLDHLVLSTNPYLHAESLPVELTAFTGTTGPRTNTLHWTTAHEDNTDRHLVERLATGTTDWQLIGEVTAAGSSRELIDYTFEDVTPLPEALYRIRTVDLDEATSVSTLISLKRPVTARQATVSVYPNPTTDRATLRFDHPTGGAVELRLYALQGQEVLRLSKQATAGANTVDLQLAQLPAGTYVLTAELGGTPLRERIVVR